MSWALRKLAADLRGATIVEFAIALPLLVLLIYAMFVFGLVLQANAGMQHALGEGARLATIYPTPSDTDILARLQSTKFGVGGGTFGTPSLTSDTATKTKTLTVTYSQPTDFVFFAGPTISLSQSKTIYLSS